LGLPSGRSGSTADWRIYILRASATSAKRGFGEVGGPRRITAAAVGVGVERLEVLPVAEHAVSTRNCLDYACRSRLLGRATSWRSRFAMTYLIEVGSNFEAIARRVDRVDARRESAVRNMVTDQAGKSTAFGCENPPHHGHLHHLLGEELLRGRRNQS